MAITVLAQLGWGALVWGLCFGLFAMMKVIYNLFLSPLRNAPGPILARATSLWLTFVDLSGSRTRTIHELHKRYGQTVRVAPNELSFSNVDCIKEIYGQQTSFMKAEVYDTMSLRPFGIFGMRNKEDHSQRRRLLSHAFAQSSLTSTEPLIRSHIEKLLGQVRKRVDEPMDMVYFFRLVAFDIVGDLFLGQSFGGLDTSEPPEFLIDMDLHFIAAGIEANFPPLYTIFNNIPLPSIRRLFDSRNRAHDFGRKALQKYLSTYGRDSGRKDLLSKVVCLKSETGEPNLTDLEIYTEIANLVSAGTDTTSMTLSYIFWELAKQPYWQKRLFEELHLKMAESTESVAAFADLVHLPILDAVVQEALRLHPAAPASLPRETPAGGRVLNGIHVPERTTVSMQCYTTQRDPNVFTDPDIFDPIRYLHDQSDEMKEMFMPFSKGTRACIGKNLALMELKLITAALIREFSVALAPQCTEDSMAMMDHFLVLPKGGRCDLVFTPRNH